MVGKGRGGICTILPYLNPDTNCICDAMYFKDHAQGSLSKQKIHLCGSKIANICISLPHADQNEKNTELEQHI